MEFKLGVIISLFVIANGDFLGTIRSLWNPHTNTASDGSSARSSGGNGGAAAVSGRSFSARSGGGPYDDGDPYMMSGSNSRGHGGGGGGGGWGGGWGGWGNDHQNLDLYSLLGGLSFASLLGATIIYLARRNTSGRRRRSADGMSYLEDDEIDFSEDLATKGLNIVELIDSFLDNNAVFNVSSKGSFSNSTKSNKSSHYKPVKIHLGPGLTPHKLSG